MLPSVFDICVPRDDSCSENFSPDLFAAKLRPVKEPNLIILDEIARHLWAAKAKTVGQITLAGPFCFR